MAKIVKLTLLVAVSLVVVRCYLDLHVYHYHLYSEETVGLRVGELNIEMRPSYPNQKESAKVTVVSNPYSLIITHSPSVGIETIRLDDLKLLYGGGEPIVEIDLIEADPGEFYRDGRMRRVTILVDSGDLESVEIEHKDLMLKGRVTIHFLDGRVEQEVFLASPKAYYKKKRKSDWWSAIEGI